MVVQEGVVEQGLFGNSLSAVWSAAEYHIDSIVEVHCMLLDIWVGLVRPPGTFSDEQESASL